MEQQMKLLWSLLVLVFFVGCLSENSNVVPPHTKTVGVKHTGYVHTKDVAFSPMFSSGTSDEYNYGMYLSEMFADFFDKLKKMFGGINAIVFGSDENMVAFGSNVNNDKERSSI